MIDNFKNDRYNLSKHCTSQEDDIEELRGEDGGIGADGEPNASAERFIQTTGRFPTGARIKNVIWNFV